MEFTFEYDVKTTNTNVIIASVKFKEELTDEQAKRLKASFRTGKYHLLDEDDSIQDIYDMIYEEAIRMEEQEEYGHLVGTEVKTAFFRYPMEIA